MHKNKTSIYFAEAQFLQQLKDRNEKVSVFLISGIRLQGRIGAFDERGVLLLADSANQFIRKPAISTICLATQSNARRGKHVRITQNTIPD